jgi:hypothetical protein
MLHRSHQQGLLTTRRDGMHKNGDEIELNTEEASGGVTRQGVRYVLAISLGLTIVMLSVIWIYAAYA